MGRFCLSISIPICLGVGILVPWQLGYSDHYLIHRGILLFTIGWSLMVMGFTVRRHLDPRSLGLSLLRSRVLAATVSLLVMVALLLAPYMALALLELSALL